MQNGESSPYGSGTEFPLAVPAGLVRRRPGPVEAVGLLRLLVELRRPAGPQLRPLSATTRPDPDQGREGRAAEHRPRDLPPRRATTTGSLDVDVDGVPPTCRNEVPFWFWKLFNQRVKSVSPTPASGELWGNASTTCVLAYDAVMNYAFFRACPSSSARARRPSSTRRSRPAPAHVPGAGRRSADEPHRQTTTRCASSLGRRQHEPPAARVAVPDDVHRRAVDLLRRRDSR